MLETSENFLEKVTSTQCVHDHLLVCDEVYKVLLFCNSIIWLLPSSDHVVKSPIGTHSPVGCVHDCLHVNWRFRILYRRIAIQLT